MSYLRTVLYPTDFSDCSRYAFRVARSLAREQHARLIIAHVNQTVGPGDGGCSASAPRETDDSRARFWEVLHRLQSSDPALDVEYHMTDGNPAEEILRLADQTRCDVIVMGTHGRTGLRRLLMGSVAEEVL